MARVIPNTDSSDAIKATDLVPVLRPGQDAPIAQSVDDIRGPEATTSAKGLMSAGDKTKLESGQTAAGVSVESAGFTGNLSGTDNTAQKAFETLDGLSVPLKLPVKPALSTDTPAAV